MAYLKVETLPLFPKVRHALLELLADLSSEEWEMPTVCKGWNVKDVALHLLDVEMGNISRRRDGVGSGSPGDIGLVQWLNDHNEQWVAAARRISPRLLQELLAHTGEIFDGYLNTLDADAVTAHVSWASDDLVPVWLDIAREYTERWVHQQQIRDATDRPGLQEEEFVGPVIQTFVHALPVAYRHVEASEGAVVQLRVTGPGGGMWHVKRDATAWQLESGPHSDPGAQVTVDGDGAWRLFTRNPMAPVPTVEGDEAIGRQVMKAVAIIA
jgi:uncharacterized protein (TIGR03083 family)